MFAASEHVFRPCAVVDAAAVVLHFSSSVLVRKVNRIKMALSK